MIRTIRTATANLNIGRMAAGNKTEPPMLTFQRMAYGYVNNDWMAVVSGCGRLVITFLATLLVHSK